MRAEVIDVNSRRSLLSLLFLLSFVVASCAEPIAPSLDLTPTSQTLISGQTAQLTATRRFPGGALEDVTARVAYTTSDRTIASINDRGVVATGTATGTVIIKAFDSVGDATAIASFTVVPAVITSIDVSPPVVALTRVSQPRAFTATAHFNNGKTDDVTNKVVWSSSNTDVAIVGNTQLDRGVVIPVATGNTTIVATDATTGITGRSTVFVTGGELALVSIIVTPNPATVPVSMTQTLVATGVFADGSTKNVGTSVTWSSSRTDVATVSATGVVSGIALGDTTITATGTGSSSTLKGSAAAKVVP
ncbi:MAG: von Willebrand factor type domain protein [Myxococcaceae bacterium]|nr:von Willebrand factor type domain protein [Myxococcaceae bacterium]